MILKIIEKFNKKKATQNLEYQEAQLRVQLRTGELKMTSMAQRVPRNLRKWEESCPQRARIGDGPLKLNVAGVYNLHFLANRGNKTHQGVGTARHNTEKLEGTPCSIPLILPQRQEWIVLNPLRRQKKLILQYRRGDLHTRILGDIFHVLSLFYRTHDQLPMKVPQPGKNQKHSNSNLGRMRKNSVQGKSRSDEE